MRSDLTILKQPLLNAVEVRNGMGDTSIGEVSGISLLICSRVPSIIWQFLWSWVLGPFLLFTMPVYHDIYHWRQQTIIAIIAKSETLPLIAVILLILN